MTATKFFIAVPADPQGVGIHGIGQTASAALADAYACSNTKPPIMDFDGDFWTVTDQGQTERFEDEADACARFERKGFNARECTERLYRHVEANGADLNFWTRNAAGLDDLHDDAAAA